MINKSENPYQPPQSMQEIELQVEVDRYPIIKVIIGYAILGTLCGIIVSVLGTLLINGFALQEMNFTLGITIVSVVGFMPALITGGILAWKRFFIKNFLDYIKIALLGLVISISYGFLLMCFFLGIGIIGVKEIKIFLLMGVVGAISAVIVGKLLLPNE